MKMMKKVMVALAFLGLTGSALAQSIVGDIASIHSVYSGANPCSTPGTDIRFVIRLGDTDADPYQRFELFPKSAYTNYFTIDELKSMYPLKLKMSTGHYATLVETKYNNSGVYEGKTDFTFSYIVQPGDVGLPLTIAYKSGDENTAGEVYTWLNSEYWNIGDINNNATFKADPRADYAWGSDPVAIWRLGNFSLLPGEVRDATLAKSGIKVQTFMLNETVELNVGDVREYTLTTTTTVEDNLTLYIWSGNPENFFLYNQNGVQGDGENNIVAVTVPAGSSTSHAFKIKGNKATNPTGSLYISNLYGPQEDASNYYSTVPVTINSTQPTVILNVDNGGEYQESDSVAHYLTVTLSEPARQKMTVTLSVPTEQSNLVRFDSKTVTIEQGQTEGAPVSFYVLDDNNKGKRQVSITSENDDNEYFVHKRDAKITIENVAPVLSVAVNTLAIQDTPHEFIFDMSDVEADKTGGTVTFNSTDGWMQEFTTSSGTATHTFTKVGTYTVTVTARDKDNGTSQTLSYEVNVSEPMPKDSVSIVPRPGTTDEYDRYVISETESAAGAMMIVLSKKPVEEVKVKLALEESATNCIKLLNEEVIINPGSTNAIFRFTVLDGTATSSANGIKITPTITSGNSTIYSRINPGYVYVENAAPKINVPVNGDDTTYSAVPIDYEQEFLYSIEDVKADLSGMKILVNWGDGTDEKEYELAGSGATIKTNDFSNIGTISGSLTHKYDTIPSTYYTVTMTAMDKDGVPQGTSTFYVKVVPAPVISVSTTGEIPMTDVICEESDKAYATPVSVKLSAPIPYDVTVALSVTNETGSLKLSSTNVVIKANSRESGMIFVTPSDGTEATPGSKFEIYATLVQGSLSDDQFNEVKQIINSDTVPCVFWIGNVIPVAMITSPAGTSSEAPLEIALNTDVKFSWSSQDVKADTRTAYWSFGDGSTFETNSNSGTVTHTYRTAGSYQVSLYVMDKDGDYSETVFAFVKVTAGKVLEVTEMGPNSTTYKPAGASFSGEMYGRNSGLGAGKVVIPAGAEASYDIAPGGDNVTTYTYGRQVTSATILAIPYRVNSGSLDATVDVLKTVWNHDGSSFTTNVVPFMYDSFFYTWVPGSITADSENGVFVQKDADKPLAPTRVAVNLPTEDGEGNLSQSVMAVYAVFSREYLPHDFTGKTDVNLGDINLDGVPDIIASKNTGNGMTRAANAATVLGIGGEEGANNAEGAVDFVATINLGTFNGDYGKDAEGNTASIGDFLPANVSGSVAQFIPSISNIFAAVGSPFTGLLETRGFDDHLNYERDSDGAALDPAFPLDEPGADIGVLGGTDPTLADTDGDGLPDGWEYYFWWFYGHAAEDSGESSKPAGLVGYRYNPNNITDGEPIKRTDIFTAFNPLVADDAILTSSGDARDIDNDGVPDVLELTLGTNPVHWDTDGDGLPDGWEVMMGTDPCSADSSMNPDNDYMAKAVVTRQRVPVRNTSDQSVAFYLLSDGGKTYWNEYRYGRGENVPGAVIPVGEIGQGRPFAVGSLEKDLEIDNGSAEEVSVVLLHWQVYQEFGFHPMTGWSIHEVDFTAIATNIVNEEFVVTSGPAVTNTAAFTTYDEFLVAKVIMNTLTDAPEGMEVEDLARYTTDPRTPDSDVVCAEKNGTRMPVLWDGMPDGWELYVSLGGTGAALADMAISPWKASDGSTQFGRYDVDGPDADGLANTSEFSGLRCQVFYTNDYSYTSIFNPVPDPTDETKGFISILRPERDLTWLNKMYPTDPWQEDTDGDLLTDSEEMNAFFRYVNGIDPIAAIGMGGNEFRGGGLNPLAIDTDEDGLPDTWEVQYAGSDLVNVKDEEGNNVVPEKQYIDNGMDPTHGSAADGPFLGDAYSGPDQYAGFEYRDMDYDNDGLENYQEYWTQAIRAFRYDVTYSDVPKDSGSTMFFTLTGKDWDTTAFTASGAPKYFIMPINQKAKMYASTDPSEPDTDMDGMDDYWELYHGLNPLLGDVHLAEMLGELEVVDIIGAALGYVDGAMNPLKWDSNPLLREINGGELGSYVTPDFVKYPWMNGMPDVDVDADGLLNFEEYLHGLETFPNSANTDPSPIWLTDASSPESIVRDYLPRGHFYWDDRYGMSYDELKLLIPNIKEPINYVFSFEMNEGYDTDNDGISDKNEMIATSTAQSDPLNSDDPIRRQALWFEGTDSAAVTFERDFVRDYSFLKSFTVEFWVKPEEEKADGSGFVSGTKEAVFIDRPIYHYNADASDTEAAARIRSTFRIGYGRLASSNSPDKRLYALYENAGGHDAETGVAVLYGPDMTTNWTHVAASYDGVNGVFSLYVNGRKYASEGSVLVPANGTGTLSLDADHTNKLYKVTTYDYVQGINAYTNRLVLGAKVAKQVHGAAPTIDIVARPGAVPTFDWSMYTAFFRGYMDEVRVWDGARTSTEINNDHKKRYIRADEIANRDMIVERRNMGWSREIGRPQLPAELVYHYTFDNLFSADVAESVATSPRGFMAPSVQMNRPETWDGVCWWKNMEGRNTVYNNYRYIPWIENTMEHLPNYYGMVKDSRYWSKLYSGEIGSLGTEALKHLIDEYTFNFTADPYGLAYRNNRLDSMYNRHNFLIDAILASSSSNSLGFYTEFEGFHIVNYPSLMWSVDVGMDLLPLGNTWAKLTRTMWDNDSPSSVWAETGEDTDNDGLPDWWEAWQASIDSSWTNLSWDSPYPGDPTLSCGEKYMRDIANGYTEGNYSNPNADRIVQTSDIDMDGLPDWWEDLFNLSASSAEGENGAYGDPDDDGLCNYAEYLVSEYYHSKWPDVFPVVRPDRTASATGQKVSDYFLKTGTKSMYLGLMFTDHDFCDDWWEDLYHVDFANRFVYDSHMDYDDDGWSNWAEARYGASDFRSNPTLQEYLTANGEKATEYPVPVLKTKIQYRGSQSGPIKIMAYSQATGVNGIPDAIYTIQSLQSSGAENSDSGGESGAEDETSNLSSKYCGYWSEKELRLLLSPGSVRPGSIKVTFHDSIDNFGATYSGVVAVDIGNVPETTGKLFMTNVDQLGGISPIEVGMVDYLTGKVVLYLGKFKGTEFHQRGAGPYTEDVNGQPVQYSVLKAENSYITITYTSKQVSAFAATYYLSDPDPSVSEVMHRGHLREGINYFEAYMDVNGDNVWNAGEPYGVATPFAVDVGWDQNEVNIELTDYMTSYVRYSVLENTRSTERWANGGSEESEGSDVEIDGSGAAEYTIIVKRTHINGRPVNPQVNVFEKQLKAPRNYLTEADIMENGSIAFDWAFNTAATQAVYDVYIAGRNINTNGFEDPIISFTNNYSAVRAKAEPVSPMGGSYIYTARPVFKWKMPESYPGFVLQIKNSAGKVIYNSGPQQRPITDNEGNCVWTCPISAGDYIPSTGSTFQSNRKYTWQVIALSELYTLAAANNSYWSAAESFRLDVNEPRQSGGYGGIKGTVKYFGPAKKFTNLVRFQVFDNAGFVGIPSASYTLSNKDCAMMVDEAAEGINAHAWGLATQSGGYPYYVMAFIDSNNNGVRDAWESWGYANYYGLDSKHPYDPLPVMVDPEVVCPEVEIFIQDTDIDQDWFPDSWEYEQNPSEDFLGKIGAFDSDNNDAEINWTLSTTGTRPAMASMGMLLTMTGVTDSDNDGLADNIELLLGSSATASSTSGDGYLDGAKAILGLTPSDTLSLSMGGVSGQNVDWTVTVKQASNSAANAVRSLLSSTLGTTACTYEVQFRASLESGSWTTVKSGAVTLNGTQSFSTDISDIVGQYPESGFFRVILSK